jgi:hypothetical protein
MSWAAAKAAAFCALRTNIANKKIVIWIYLTNWASTKLKTRILGVVAN